jgi:hypothetical protein
MVGWMTTPGEYSSTFYYYPHKQGKDSYGKNLRDKIQLKKVTLPPNCQFLQCNPLRLIINESHSITTEPCVLRHYRLGASLIECTDPTGSFLLELLLATTVVYPVPNPEHLAPAKSEGKNCSGGQIPKTDYSY